MRNNPKESLQHLFNRINCGTPIGDQGLFKPIFHNTLSFYDACNNTFLYFSEDDQLSQKKFSHYFHFFDEISKTEDAHVTTSELSNRAYIATVLFGDCKKGEECKTLQRLINENYGASKNPIHDAFSVIVIQKNEENIDLIFWRALINGVKTKKAIALFANAVDISRKFGKILNSNDYDLCVTKIYPNIHHVKKGILYVYAYKGGEEKLGYVFLKHDKLASGTVSLENLRDFAISQPLTIEIEKRIFDSVNHHISTQESISRKLKIEEIEKLQGKLIYERFNEHEALGTLCKKFKVSENTFNHCLSLIPKNKKQDYLPNVTVREGVYVLTKLAHHDPRAFLLGMMTKCCQFIGGDSEFFVIDGWTKKNNGFYVLLKAKKDDENHPVYVEDGTINDEAYNIIGQAYAWRSVLGNLVFDSWENAWHEHDEIAVKMLTTFSKQIITSLAYGIFRVTIGMGGKTPEVFRNRKCSTHSEIMLEGSQYHDSKSQAVIVSMADLPDYSGPWQKNIDTLIDSCDGLSEAEKITLKKAPYSMHYSAIVERLHSPGGILKEILLFHFEPNHIISVMIVLQMTYPEKLEEVILLLWQKNNSLKEDILCALEFAHFLNRLDGCHANNITVDIEEAKRQLILIREVLNKCYGRFDELPECLSLVFYNVTNQDNQALDILNTKHFSSGLISALLQVNVEKLCNFNTLKILLSNIHISCIFYLLDVELLTETQKDKIWFFLENNLVNYASKNIEEYIYFLLIPKSLKKWQFQKIIQIIDFTSYVPKSIHNFILLMNHKGITKKQRTLLFASMIKNLSTLMKRYNSVDHFLQLVTCRVLNKAQWTKIIFLTDFDNIFSQFSYENKAEKILKGTHLTEAQRYRIISMKSFTDFVIKSAQFFVETIECEMLTDNQRNKIFSLALNRLPTYFKDDLSAFKLLRCEKFSSKQRDIIWKMFSKRFSFFFSKQYCHQLPGFLDLKTLSVFQKDEIWCYGKNNLQALLCDSGIYLLALLKCDALTAIEHEYIWATLKGRLSTFFDSFSLVKELFSVILLSDAQFNQFLLEVNLNELLIEITDPLEILKGRKLTNIQRSQLLRIIDIKICQSYDGRHLKELLDFKEFTENDRSQILSFLNHVDFEEDSPFKINSILELRDLFFCKMLTERNHDQILEVIEKNISKLIKYPFMMLNLFKIKNISLRNVNKIFGFFKSHSLGEEFIFRIDDIVDFLKLNCLSDEQKMQILSFSDLKNAIYIYVDSLEELRKPPVADNILHLIDYKQKELEACRCKLLELSVIETLNKEHIAFIANALQDVRLEKLFPAAEERNKLLAKFDVSKSLAFFEENEDVCTSTSIVSMAL